MKFENEKQLYGREAALRARELQREFNTRIQAKADAYARSEECRRAEEAEKAKRREAARQSRLSGFRKLRSLSPLQLKSSEARVKDIIERHARSRTTPRPMFYRRRGLATDWTPEPRVYLALVRATLKSKVKQRREQFAHAQGSRFSSIQI